MRRIGSKDRSPDSQDDARDLLLYVEDDDDNWEVALLRLSPSYRVLRARNAREACTLLRERGREIDVILMDIELRGSELTGIELTRLLRGDVPPELSVPDYAEGLRATGRPIIFVTAHGARHTRRQLIHAGAEQVVSKPVDFAELREAIAEASSQRTRGKPAT